MQGTITLLVTMLSPWIKWVAVSKGVNISTRSSITLRLYTIRVCVSRDISFSSGTLRTDRIIFNREFHLVTSSKSSASSSNSESKNDLIMLLALSVTTKKAFVLNKMMSLLFHIPLLPVWDSWKREHVSITHCIDQSIIKWAVIPK